MASPALAPAFEPYPVSSAALAERLLNFVLFITIVTSSIVLIEPSPHDGLMFVLLVACVAARVPFDRKLTPLLLLMTLWLVGGGLSVIQVADTQEAHPITGQNPIVYFGTSVYLSLATIMFACLFSGGSMTRLLTLRRAYLIAAVIATAAGYVAYFHLLPGSDVLLSDGRIRATFKDPNVYGPFLIFPLVLLIVGLLGRGIRFVDVVLLAFLSSGVLLSFSRGAWIHFLVSTLIAIAILLAAAPSPRTRLRITVVAVMAVAAIALVVIALTSIDSIHEMLLERAKAIQPYDVGSGGRFSLQQLALSEILDHPNGLGPFGFSDLFGGQQHNVYMQGFLVYGWLGGAAYLTIVVVTLMIGLTTLRQEAPWQPYLIAAYATFVGEAGEGIIVDTDHWRHFFLALGLVWGLTVANINYRRSYAFSVAASAAAY
jgi:hypothetical protein